MAWNPPFGMRGKMPTKICETDLVARWYRWELHKVGTGAQLLQESVDLNALQQRRVNGHSASTSRR